MQPEEPKNATLSATSLQPPVSGPLTRPGLFVRGMNSHVMPPPSPVSVPREASSNAANFSYNGHPQLLQRDQSIQSVSASS